MCFPLFPRRQPSSSLLHELVAYFLFLFYGEWDNVKERTSFNKLNFSLVHIFTYFFSLNFLYTF